MGNDQVFNRARTHHLAKKYGEAIKLYQMVLMKDPAHLDANYLLGTVYVETGKLEAAKKYLLKAERIMPESPYIKVNLSNVYKDMGDLDTAIFYLVDALQLQHDLPEAVQNLDVVIGMMPQKSAIAANRCLEYGLACIQDGRKDDAMAILTAGNSLDPDNVYIRYLTVVLAGEQPDKELQDAFDRLEPEDAAEELTETP
jgi:tetratricopeptide (TPR) repeat protein